MGGGGDVREGEDADDRDERESGRMLPDRQLEELKASHKHQLTDKDKQLDDKDRQLDDKDRQLEELKASHKHQLDDKDRQHGKVVGVLERMVDMLQAAA
ncbi:hypothetical protein COO60DRAFT_1643773 [Scenedesmus sp. NREL 46B-D3]|nr:hypothetical protein COO60DRAFT_1643773 [Scenedesmus sp. NREL 46B-D3]